ncbi:hypothetical protein MP638_001427 [Amoeboaphelidium occidentale]|nr:hypothetical protein MP638_001427 [Amoeboaphelidium occidentale]
MDYLDIDAILAEQEKIKVTVSDGVTGLISMLQPDEKTREGKRVELPFWLAHVLGINEFVQFDEPPKCFRNSVMEKLKSHPVGVDLSKISPSFFRIGLHSLRMLDIDPTLVEVLRKSMEFRIQRIFDIACAPHLIQDSYDFSETLDDWEKEVFDISRSSMTDFYKWETLQTKTGRITRVEY